MTFAGLNCFQFVQNKDCFFTIPFGDELSQDHRCVQVTTYALFLFVEQFPSVQSWFDLDLVSVHALGKNNQ